MTRLEFAEEYAKRSGMGMKQLFEYGFVPIACHCDYEECKGWAMVVPMPELYSDSDVKEGKEFVEQWLQNNS